MAIAVVELGKTAFSDRPSSAIHGACHRSETLTISGSTATLAAALTAGEAQIGVEVFRISNDATACYFAVGTTPDPDATTATAASTARRYLAAGLPFEGRIAVGEKVAVKAVA